MIDIGKVRQNHKPIPSFSDITAVIFVRYRPNLTTGTMDPIKYIAQNRRDRDWGLTVCSVGHQRISPGEDYPPRKHNQEYMFDPAQGRILPEYQLLYIVEGKGIFRTGSAGDMKVAAGDMFIIFPGEWHSYMPDPDTGWNEYWIGFQGVNIDHRVETGFFSPASPLYCHPAGTVFPAIACRNRKPPARADVHDRHHKPAEPGRRHCQAH